MRLVDSVLNGVKVVEPKVFGDQRGFFFEAFNQRNFEDLEIDAHFVQDNVSRSGYGVLRGLHFQKPPKAQAKFVRVLDGTVLDIAVDLRVGSPSYGQSFQIELSGENKLSVFIPKGFAHGFVVLSDSALFTYKCDEFYAPECDSGIIYNDTDLKLDWRVPDASLKLSEKDSKLGTLKNCNSPFTYK